jgi:hypothetical protein
MIEPIDEGECIPEKISHFELELIVIFFSQARSNLIYLISCSIDIVFDRRLTKPAVELTVTLLEPEKS